MNKGVSAMNKIIRFIMLCMVLILFAGGCGTINSKQTGDNGDSNNQDGNEDNNEDEDSKVTFKAEVIEAGDSLLVTPDKESNEFKSSDKISVGITELILKGLKGEDITLQDLKPGDILEITYNGVIMESYPAQIRSSDIKVVGHNNLIDGYLAMIDDIWNEDSGLNSEIEMITVDTTGWIDLTDIEKEIILASMKEAYGFEITVGTFDELADQGIIDKENLYFENGVHIVISDISYHEKSEKITYSVSKWRSGLGAVGSDGSKAELKDGKWIITKGSMWIS
jgi:uncharacterized protein YceK